MGFLLVLLSVALGVAGIGWLGTVVASGGPWSQAVAGATLLLAAPLAWFVGDGVDGRSEAARRAARWLVAPVVLLAGAVLVQLDLPITPRSLRRVHAVGLALLLGSSWSWWALGQPAVRGLFEARPGWFGNAPARVKAGLGWYLVFVAGTAGSLFATLGPGAVGPVWLAPRHRVPLALVGAVGSGLIVLLGARAARAAWRREDEAPAAAPLDEPPGADRPTSTGRASSDPPVDPDRGGRST